MDVLVIYMEMIIKNVPSFVTGWKQMKMTQNKVKWFDTRENGLKRRKTGLKQLKRTQNKGKWFDTRGNGLKPNKRGLEQMKRTQSKENSLTQWKMA